MTYYSLVEKDHPRQSWVIMREERASKSRKRGPEISPIVHQLLGQPFPNGLQLKPQYARYRCRECGRFDAEEIFKEGFDDEVKIRLKGDFGHTTDRIFVVSDRFVTALGSVNAQGYELKSLGGSGWHAMRVTCLVGIAAEVIKTSQQACKECARPFEACGCVQKVSEFKPPTSPYTLFTSTRSWPFPFFDKDIFMTEDLMLTLKQNKIKGGYCYRLYTDEEWSNLKINPVGIVDDRPRWSTIFL